MSQDLDSVAECLRLMDDGDEEAIDRLLPLIYEDLRRLARRIQGPGALQNTLNPTALVHEAYARIANAESRTFNDRTHFMNVAARAMRQLLTDHARKWRSEKRGGDAQRVTLYSHDVVAEGVDLDLVSLDEALSKLTELFPRQARVVELRFLTGLSVEETAEVLEISPRTTKADWQMARAWLSRELSKGDTQA